MSTLFDVGVTAKGEQFQIDSRALWWMAAQQHKDLAGRSGRFVNPSKSGMEPRPSPRSERQLAREAANKFYGPFDEKKLGHCDQRDSVAERLRKKWRQQRNLWINSFLYSDNAGQLSDMYALIEIWADLRAAGVRVVPNWSDGNPISVELAKRMGIARLIELVTRLSPDVGARSAAEDGEHTDAR